MPSLVKVKWGLSPDNGEIERAARRMDTAIREYLNTLIDDLASDIHLKMVYSIIRKHIPIENSEQDAVFGFILGTAFFNFNANYFKKYAKCPSDSEIEFFFTLFDRRMPHIKSEILKYSNL